MLNPPQSGSSSTLQAVCCEDHEHCCPQGYSCNMETGTCEKKHHGALIYSVPQRALLHSKARGAKGPVSCGGTGKVQCPEDDTCCPTSASEWACCPLPRVRSVVGFRQYQVKNCVVMVTNLTPNRLCAAQTRSTAVPQDSPVT